MTDRISAERRSWNMSQVKSKNTKPEILIRKILHKEGLRFRIHKKELPGQPDIVLKKYKTVIFVHGCFWHQHKGCQDSKIPKTNTEKWEKKLKANEKRDKENEMQLKSMGWKVLIIWECEIKKVKNNVSIIIDQIIEKENGDKE